MASYVIDKDFMDSVIHYHGPQSLHSRALIMVEAANASCPAER